MQKVINIKLKDNRKLAAVKDIEVFFNKGLKESLDIVNQLLDDGEIQLDDTKGVIAFFGKDPQDVGRILASIFDCEFIDEVAIAEHERWYPKISPETEFAIKWYDNLGPLEQLHVDLLVQFRQVGPARG